jgi:hypothetical protein
MEAVTKFLTTVIDGVEYLVCGDRILPRVAGGDGTFTTEEPTSIEEWRTYLTEVRARMSEIDEEHRGQYIDPTSAHGQEWNILGERRELAERTIEQLEARHAFLEASAGGDTARAGLVPDTAPRRDARRGHLRPDHDQVLDRRSRPGARGAAQTARCARSRTPRFAHDQADETRARDHIARLLDADREQSEDARHRVADLPARVRQDARRPPADRPRSSARCRSGRARPAASPSSTRSTRRSSRRRTSREPVPGDRAVETIVGTNEWKASPRAPSPPRTPRRRRRPRTTRRRSPSRTSSSRRRRPSCRSRSSRAGLGRAADRDGDAAPGRQGRPRGDEVRRRRRPRLHEPKGIITAATTTVTAGGVAAFAIADLYKVFEALPPRFRPRAQWVANLFTYDKVRQFDTAGGSGVWQEPGLGLGGGVGGARSATRAPTACRSCSVARPTSRRRWPRRSRRARRSRRRRLPLLRDRRPGRHGHRDPAAPARREPPADRPARALRLLAQQLGRAVRVRVPGPRHRLVTSAAVANRRPGAHRSTTARPSTGAGVAASTRPRR